MVDRLLTEGMLPAVEVTVEEENSLIMCAEFKEHVIEAQSVSYNGPNAGSFTWEITDKDMISKILNASNKQKFESDPFTMAKLRWSIELYPNEDDDDSEGSVNAFFEIAIHATWIRFNCLFNHYSM